MSETQEHKASKKDHAEEAERAEGQTRDREYINPSDVDREVGEKILQKTNPVFRIQNATYQEIVFWLGLMVIAIILITIIGLGVFIFRRTPIPPTWGSDPANLTTAQNDSLIKVVDMYSKLTDIAITGAKEMFESIARTMVPILTTIIGYILGTQHKPDFKKINNSQNDQN